MAETNPLDPGCPCASGRLLSACCGAATGGEFTDPEVDQALLALAKFGNRAEFDAAMRRNKRRVLADLPPAQGKALMVRCEGEMHSAIVLLLHTELPVRHGASAATLLLRRDGATMPARPRALLAQWAAQPLSLLEVLETFPGEGIVLRDHLRAFTVRAHERTASRLVEPGGFLLTRVRTRPDGVPVLDVPTLYFQARARQPVVAWLHDATRGEPGTRVEPRTMIDEAFLLWQHYMAEALTAPPPRVTNDAGHELVLCRAAFAVADRAAAVAALAAHARWERDRDGDDDAWVWFEELGGGMRRALAHLSFEDGKAFVEVNSRQRLEAVRTMLAAMGLQFAAVQERSAAEIFAQVRERGTQPQAMADADVASPVVARELDRELDRHYRAWVDQPLPMFDGRSPRAMAKVDPDAVSRAIWEIGNPPPGAPRYDADWMYAELGVRQLGAGRFEPGLGGE